MDYKSNTEPMHFLKDYNSAAHYQKYHMSLEEAAKIDNLLRYPHKRMIIKGWRGLKKDAKRISKSVRYQTAWDKNRLKFLN